MDAICKGLEKTYPETNEGRGVELSPLDRELLGDVRTPVVVLLMAVGLVLLIACTNVANLLLARAESRQREIAVRLTLGAGRTRILHQLTTESVLLAAAGAGAGVLLARWCVVALMASSPITFPSYIHPGIDPRVTVFTVILTGLVALALGVAPTVHVRSGNLGDAFKQASSHATDSRSGRGFRSFLVVAEAALAMLLLVGAGLLIRSVQELAAIHPGYDPEHVLRMRVSLPRLAVGNPSNGDARTIVYARDILQRVSEIPSAESVAIGSDVPLSGGGAIFYTAEGQPPVTAQNRPRAYIHAVSPSFFRTVRIAFLAGRSFWESETRDSNVAIVSESLVRRFWPDQDPIGKRIKDGPPDSKSSWSTIIGVVNDMKYRGLPNNPTADPDIFIPISVQPRNFNLLIRTLRDAASLAPAVRRGVHDAASTSVVFNVSTMQQLIARQTARLRFTGWLMAIFASAALLLAMLGIYGVISYAVSRRTPEIASA
jgi:putative ABC transport system permease protein